MRRAWFQNSRLLLGRRTDPLIQKLIRIEGTVFEFPVIGVALKSSAAIWTSLVFGIILL